MSKKNRYRLSLSFLFSFVTGLILAITYDGVSKDELVSFATGLGVTFIVALILFFGLKMDKYFSKLFNQREPWE